MRYLFTMFLILYSSFCFGQTKILDSLEQDVIELGYDKEITRYDYRLLKHKLKKNRKQLCFFDGFDDSATVFLNDKIVFSNWLRPDSIAQLTIVIVKLRNTKANSLKIEFHTFGKYIEFPVDRRYRFVELFHRRDDKNDSDTWNVNFTNNIPHRGSL